MIYPNIEWLRTASTAPRPEHLAYAGLVLPADDPFWTDNQPGNEYNCKCDWRTTDREITARPADSDIYKPARGLEGNPAETGELITERHPYFKRNTNAPAWIDSKAILQCPDEVCFIEKTAPGGKTYLEHLLVDKVEEAPENRTVAGILLLNGYRDVKLLPQINQTEKMLRRRYFGKDYAEKHLKSNPDAMIGDKLIEFKSSNRNNLSKHILNAARKSDIVLVRLTEPMTPNAIIRCINSQWAMQDRENLTEIMLVNNELRSFKRPK